MRFAVAAVLSLILASACGDATLDGSAGATGGRFVLRRMPDGEALLEAPARALVCERDSTVAIVAADGDWGVGLGLRTTWPLAEPTSFAIRAAPDSLGTGAVAARSLRDSVSEALTARNGSLRLEPLGRAAGRFEVTAVGVADDTVLLEGVFRNVPVTTGACPP